MYIRPYRPRRRKRNSSRPVFFLVLFFLAYWAVSAFAASGYISDKLIVYLKDNTGQSSKSVARVQTGDQVEIIGTKDNFHYVRTTNGAEGWILKQYILFSKPKEIQIGTLQTENNELKRQLAEERQNDAKKLDELRQTFEASNDQSLFLEKMAELDKITLQRNELSQSNKELEVLLQIAESERDELRQEKGNVVELRTSRDKLAKQVTQLRSFLDTAIHRDTNSSGLNIDSRILWLLAGALILLVGILIGKMGKTKKKPKLSF